MARLIDADALEKHIADTFGYPAADILHEIATFPTVNAVEVVRCKDCRKYRTDCCAMSYTDRNEDVPHYWAKTTDFCSYGERKGERKTDG